MKLGNANPLQNKTNAIIYSSPPKNSGRKKKSCLTIFKLGICVFLTIHVLFLILFVYFRYFHPVQSAYELHIKPSTPYEFVSREYDFIHHRDAQKKRRRQKQFPNINERLQIYMSNWYLPPCRHFQNNLGSEVGERIGYEYTEIKDEDKNINNEESSEQNNINYHEVTFSTGDEEGNTYATLETKVSFNDPFVLQNDLIELCMKSEERDDVERQYCGDSMHIINILKTLVIEMEKMDASSTTISKVNAYEITDWDGTNHSLPIIMNLPLKDKEQTKDTDYTMKQRDLKRNPVPYFQEYRSSSINPKRDLYSLIHKDDLDCSLPDRRKHLHTVEEETQDSSLSLTSSTYAPIIWFFNAKTQLQQLQSVIPVDIPWSWKMSKAIILNVEKLEYSLKTKNADAKNTMPIHFENELFMDNMAKGKRIEEVLKFKMIIIPSTNSLESMGVLKWALYSRSIVLMPPPTITTFAMEEILEPYVHYIPLKRKMTLSNIKQQVSWVLKNDKKARKIAELGTLFVHNLLFHEDAKADNLKIQSKILEHYSSFFINNAGK